MRNLSPIALLQLNRPYLARQLLNLVPDLRVNSRDIFGNTPLHYASSHQSPSLVTLLLPMLRRYNQSSSFPCGAAVASICVKWKDFYQV